MPELPEVETVMRGLAAVLEGRRIAAAEQRRPDLRWPFPPGLARAADGPRVLAFRRRGEIHADAARGRREPADPPRHVGPHGGAAGGAAPVPRIGPQGAVSDARGHNAPPEAHEHLVIGDRGWLARRLRRSAPLRLVDLVPTARRGRAPPAGRPRAGAAGGWLHRGGAVGGAGRQAHADQGGAAGPGRRGGPGQHLCVRGAVPRRDLAAAPGAQRGGRARRRGWCRRSRRCWPRASAPAGRRLRDYVRADGELGRFQDTLRRLRPRGRALPALPRARRACQGIGRIVQSGRSTFYLPAGAQR